MLLLLLPPLLLRLLVLVLTCCFRVGDLDPGIPQLGGNGCLAVLDLQQAQLKVGGQVWLVVSPAAPLCVRPPPLQAARAGAARRLQARASRHAMDIGAHRRGGSPPIPPQHLRTWRTSASSIPTATSDFSRSVPPKNRAKSEARSWRGTWPAALRARGAWAQLQVGGGGV